MTVAGYAGVQHGLDALRKGGVAPKLLIIDDGWQSTELDEALRPISETGAARSENKVRSASILPCCRALASRSQGIHMSARIAAQSAKVHLAV